MYILCDYLHSLTVYSSKSIHINKIYFGGRMLFYLCHPAIYCLISAKLEAICSIHLNLCNFNIRLKLTYRTTLILSI